MPILRPASTPLKNALALGTPLAQADLFQIGLSNGSLLTYTSAPFDIVSGGLTYVGTGPYFVERSRWNVVNTMEVANLDVILKTASHASFGGGGALQLRTQIANGLLDGALFQLSRVFMPPNTKDTTTYGPPVILFTGDCGAVKIEGQTITITVRSKSARLAQQIPRNVFQAGCLWDFCSPGCTLSAASFTSTTTVSASPAPTTMTFSVGAFPSGQIPGGTITFTSGANNLLKRTIREVVSGTTVTLTSPLPVAPTAGDTCTVFAACDKQLPTCKNTYANKANFRGFPYVPPPMTPPASPVFGSMVMSLVAATGRSWMFAPPTPAPTVTGMSSAQAIPIPLMWGKRRVSPVLIWRNPLVDPIQGGVSGILLDGPDVGGHGWDSGGVFQLGALGSVRDAVTVNAGSLYAKTYGSTNPSSSDCHWHVPMQMALCEGPINSVSKVYIGGAAQGISITLTYGTNPIILGAQTFDDNLSKQSLFTTVFLGDTVQGPWGYFAALNTVPGGPYFPDVDLNYRSTAYVASALVDCGSDSRAPVDTPQLAFEVVRLQNPALGDGADYLPSAIISDVLLNTTFGFGMNSLDIDATSSTRYQNYCGAAGIFISPLLASPSAATDFINRLALETNSWIFWNGSAFFFVPLGDEALTGNGFTYTPDPSPAYGITNDNIVQGGKITVQRADPVDVPNRVRADFTDRTNDYAKNTVEWKDQSLITQFGVHDASSVNFEDICTPGQCAYSLDLLAKRLAYLRNEYTFTLNARYVLALPGTVVTLTDPDIGLNATPVRITKIEENAKGDLAITAEDFPGVLGIARPLTPPAWTQSAGATGGASSGGTGGGIGGPAGPGTTITVTAGIQYVEWAAGNTIMLPSTPTTGMVVWLKNVSGTPASNPGVLNGNGKNVEPWGDPLGSPVATTSLRGDPGQSDKVVYNGTYWRFVS